jgi:hypothetical protein
MAIAVICPGCKTTFRVSDKFAGQKGPCPKCKTIIEIPKPTGELKLEEPETAATAPKDSKGRSILQPIRRQETRVQPLVLGVALGGTLVVVLAAWLLGRAYRPDPKEIERLQRQLDAAQGAQRQELERQFSAARTRTIPPPLVLLGLLVVTPPLVLGGYHVLRDEETAPYAGLSLALRTTVCSAVYVGLWIGFHFVPGFLSQETWHWFFLPLPFFGIGTLVALGCFDLDATGAAVHYGCYVAATLLLRWVAGMPPVWSVS